MRQRSFLILQCAIGASAAWYIASDVLHHREPFFAPVTAVICLGMSYGQRVRRVADVMLGVAIGVLVTPLMASVSEDALRAVPSALREASTGLGARRSATVVRVVLPAAVSGIVAALIISVSRAIGETMVAALASGRLGSAPRTLDPRDPGLTMTASMAQLAHGSDQVVGSGIAFQSLFFVGALLFMMTFGLNVLADRVVRRVRARY